MTSHDVLMSQMIAMKKHLEQYVEEFQPFGADLALEFLTETLLICHQFDQEKIEKVAG